MRIFLSEHTGDARPDTLIYLRVQDVDAIAAQFGVTPGDEPWARKIALRDPDGNRLRISTPRPPGELSDLSDPEYPHGQG